MTSVTTPLPGTGLPPGFVLVEAPHADDVDAPGAWAYRAVADVDAEVQRETHGHDDMALAPADVVTGMRIQEYAHKRRFVVVRDAALDAARADGAAPPAADDVVGHLFLCLPVTSNTHLAEVYPFVRPAARRQGIGSALLALGERLALDAGRTVLYSTTEHGSEPPAGPGALVATTGSGRVPADAPGARLALAHGYALEQVDRHSVLDLPLPAGVLERHGADARAAVGDDYRTHTWTDAVPDERADQVALLFTRMSTDAPVGGVDYGEDPWDARRVRTWVDQLRSTRHGFLMTVAEHVPTRTLAAFTVLELPQDRPAVVLQEDTLVLREHRGRRLGMHVKVVNLVALRDARPGSRRVHTGNAEENTHMLAINVALGFRPAGTWASWQRRILGAGPAAETVDEERDA
ncbi:GNAT family N-acetyltransferase [Cellulosimicrobium cellulans]|uniref:GNAT family N-acetyltransferase n=1 Tax=Cellulosimicrobium cellulans TaxID=1710 RepID=UPI000848B946|nr:GNAT family N-acetyltransferase [Cellulosimicrobium cellulans]